MKSKLQLCLSILICLFFVNLHISFAADYEIIDLGSLGSGDNYAFGINNQGQVVGKSNNTAFLWENGTMTSLGTLGGSESEARDINDFGYVAGTSQLLNGQKRAFIWNSTTGMTNIGTLGGDKSISFTINNSREIGGYSFTSDNSVQHAYKWDPINNFLNLNNLGGDQSCVMQINNSGQVVGGSRISDGGATHAYIWDNVNGMVDLNPSTGGVATGINDLSQVVGYFFDNYEWNLFLWDATNGFQDLNIVSDGFGSMYRINDAGLLIGDLTGDTAFLYDTNTSELNYLIDLLPEDSEWDSLENAMDINSLGQIVGSGMKDGERRAYLLNPVAPVPEPSVILLFLFGGTWLFRSIKKK